jgi:hypothetical protein
MPLALTFQASTLTCCVAPCEFEVHVRDVGNERNSEDSRYLAKLASSVRFRRGS